MDIEWRSLTGEQIVDICDAGRGELQRRRDEADSCLELAFGTREQKHEAPAKRGPGRPPIKAKEENGNGHLSARAQQLAEAEAS